MIKKIIFLITIQNSFFLSSYNNNFVLFELVRAAFLSGFKNIFLISTLIRTDFWSKCKSIKFIFGLIRAAFFIFFCFCLSLREIVHNQCTPDDYKPLKISIGAIAKNPEMLRFVLDQKVGVYNKVCS